MSSRTPGLHNEFVAVGVTQWDLFFLELQQKKKKKWKVLRVSESRVKKQRWVLDVLLYLSCLRQHHRGCQTDGYRFQAPFQQHLAGSPGNEIPPIRYGRWNTAETTQSTVARAGSGRKEATNSHMLLFSRKGPGRQKEGEQERAAVTSTQEASEVWSVSVTNIHRFSLLFCCCDIRQHRQGNL